MIPNPRPLRRDFNTVKVGGKVEPWIDMYKAHEDDPSALLTLTFHTYAGRYENRTMDLDPRDPKVYVPEGTLFLPISDQARRMRRADGTWGPWIPEEVTE